MWSGAGVALGAAVLARRTRSPPRPSPPPGRSPAPPRSCRATRRSGAPSRAGPRDRPRAALTFDDGPGPSTPDVLDALAREGARATFFVLGRQVERHPDLVRRMAAEGHQIANHGYDHGILIFRGAAHVADQLARTERAVAAAAGAGAMTRLFRAPHGFRGPATALGARRAGYRMAAWTRGVFDSAEPGAAAIARRATTRARARARSCCCTTPTAGRPGGPASRRRTPSRTSAAPPASATSRW